MKLRNRPEQRTATRHIHGTAAVAFPGIDIRGSSMIGNLLRAAFAMALAATFTIGVLALPSAANTTEVSATGRPAAGDECTSDPQYGIDNAPAGVPPLLYFEGNLLGCYYVDEADTRVIAAGAGRYRLVERVSTLHWHARWPTGHLPHLVRLPCLVPRQPTGGP